MPSIQIYFFVFPFGECGKYITLKEYTETVYRISIYPKLNPGDQICAYFVISLFCGAPTVFVLLAMPIIAACPLRYTSCQISHPGDGVCSSQTKDQAIMSALCCCVVLDKMFWCNGPIIAPGGCIKG